MSTKNKAMDPIFINEVATSDSYSMFKHLMEVKDDMTGQQKEREPKVVKIVKQALQSLLGATFKGLWRDFCPMWTGRDEKQGTMTDLTWTLWLVLLEP